MANVNFTPEQHNAIVTNGTPLIVSAAAGSGKTAVLVERVMRMILEGGINITDLIVVTFTEAAAGEMRAKITRAILEKLEEDPKNLRLRRQLALIPRAKIQTVHSFCSSLIKTNFHRCGVSFDFSLLDEAEKNQLLADCLETVMEEEYSHFGEDTDFKAAFENFSDDRGDRKLREIVLELYGKLRSDKSPKKWLLETIAEADSNDIESIEETPWGGFLIKEARAIHAYAFSRLKAAYDELLTVPEVEEKYGDTFRTLLDFGGKLADELGKNWDDIYTALSALPETKLKASRYDDKGFLEKMKSARSGYVEAVKKIKDNFISSSGENTVKENNITAPIIKGICNLVLKLEDNFTAVKRERNVLDYSDLEHIALSLLYDEEKDEVTDIARRISEETYELLVDEFQDTNEIQDTIFRCIEPKTGNVFFVGDVKQSIYKFRLADPTIFIDKYKEAAELDEEGYKTRIKIDLNKNFRSANTVLDSTNYVFEYIMTDDFGGIDYDEKQKLYLGAKYDASYPSELTIIDLKLREDDSEEEKAVQAEAKWVANRIAELYDTIDVEENGEKRHAKYSDFAILLSSYSNKVSYFQYELSRHGIPCAVSKKENFAKRSEIMAVMSLLKVIDNPYQDIPLVAVMRSYMYGFTADEVAQTRIGNKNGYLYEGLVKLAETNEKAKNLIESLEKYRYMAKNMPVYRLIEAIYDEHRLSWFYSGMADGEARRENLGLLLGHAENYEKNGYKGLFRFITYFENKFKNESEEGAVKAEGVQILSIHKSKGLEYPVVILPDLAKKFNDQDIKKSVLFHDKLKIGIKYRDKEAMTINKSQIYNALSIKTQKELTEEEMRKLYVAMTRAKQKLVMVMSLQNAEKKIKEWAEESWNGVAPTIAANATSFGQWLIYSYIHHPDADILRGYTGQMKPLICEAAEKMEFHVISPDDIPMPDKEKEVLKRSEEFQKLELPSWFDAKYGHESLTTLPSKLSPTMIKELKGESRQYKPTVKVETSTAGGVEKGNAIHHFMEHFDFESWKNGALLSDVMEEAFEKLTDEEKQLIDMDYARAFFGSDLAELIKSAKNIRKETQFAALFTPKELGLSEDESDTVVMNGIIDLMMETDEGIIIIDYKSDKVWADPVTMANIHKEQVDIYAKAAQKTFGKPVIGKYIFLFDAKTAVKI
ncbi:MAG: helicase-exonuclease AddAB subunit AddA [Clostridia bacterium]|nr:helicase-exonuclease AddAB subunit AddA [Clostridia bacterium]